MVPQGRIQDRKVQCPMRLVIVSDVLDLEGSPMRLWTSPIHVAGEQRAGVRPRYRRVATYYDVLSGFGGREKIEGISKGMGLMH